MHKNLLLLLSFMASQTLAMEPMELTTSSEKMVVIPVQNQQRELPVRLIKLIGTIARLYVEGSPLEMSPITLISLDTWQLIEGQLEQVYAVTQGNLQAKDQIVASFKQLDTERLIDVLLAADFLQIPLLKHIALNRAQEKLSVEELLALPDLLRNEVIKYKAVHVAGPILIKDRTVCRHEDYICPFEGRKLEGCVNQVLVTPFLKVVSASDDSTIRIWDMNGTELAVCRGHEDRVLVIRFIKASYKGQVQELIASAAQDGTVRIWDMNGQQLFIYFTPTDGSSDLFDSLCLAPNKRIVAGSRSDGIIHIWDMNRNESLPISQKGNANFVNALISIMPSGALISGVGKIGLIYKGLDTTLIPLNDNGAARMGDEVIEGHAIPLNGHVSEITIVYATPDSKIITGSRDGTIIVWNESGAKLAVCKGHEKGVSSLTVTPNGKIVSGSQDTTIRIWDIDNKTVAICRGHKYVINSIAIAPSNCIVSASADSAIRIWSMNGQEIAVCRGHEGGVASVCVSPDGIIISGGDATMRIWDPMSFFNRLSFMNKEHAQVVNRILESAPHSNREEQERCWEEIWKVLEQESPPSE